MEHGASVCANNDTMHYVLYKNCKQYDMAALLLNSSQRLRKYLMSSYFYYTSRWVLRFCLKNYPQEFNINNGFRLCLRRNALDIIWLAYGANPYLLDETSYIIGRKIIEDKVLTFKRYYGTLRSLAI